MKKTTPKYPFTQSAGYIYDNTGSLVGIVFDDAIIAYEVREMAEIMIDALNKRWNEQDFDKILKAQGFAYPIQYYTLTANTYSFDNTKAEQMFSAMPQANKKTCIAYISEDDSLPNSAFTFFLNLL